jgi:putative methyltransferase (TIGR04325 family)
VLGEFGSFMRANRSLKNLKSLIVDLYNYTRFSVRFGPSQFRGIYQSFQEAEAAAPQSKKIGYNNFELAREYQARLNVNLDCSDYPVLFHLANILQDKRYGAVLDFGGNVGVHYLRYRKYLNLDDITWIICDVPEITRVGREVCANFPNIKFTNAITDIKDIKLDVFLAVGAIQYVRQPSNILEHLVKENAGPTHILIDQLPLYNGSDFVTLQNGGIVFYPQRVFNRCQYIETINKLGYSLVDDWEDSVDSCVIPFHPDKSVYKYTGLYFSREKSGGANPEKRVRRTRKRKLK